MQEWYILRRLVKQNENFNLFIKMNITQNKIDDLNLELTLEITNDDYAEGKKKILNDRKKNAEIKGFRKGQVPMSLIEKMYGSMALIDSVNNVIADNLNNFIHENKLNVLGEPLPAEDQPETDWVDGNDFTFKFEIGLKPELNFELGKEDEIVYYTINTTDKAKKEMKDNLLNQFGVLEEGEKAKEDDFIIVDFEQEEMKVEGTYVSLRSISKSAKSKFVGLKVGDSIDIDVNKTFENETDRAAMLKIKKEELAGINPIFKMTVKNVKTFVPASLNQETYDKIFGEGKVKSEAEFDVKIEERLKAEYEQEANYRFTKDAKDYLIEKAAIELPEKFFKRWLHVVNEGKFTMEEIEKEWDLFLVDFRWSMIKTYLMDKYSVKIEESDLLASAKGLAAYQFAMYGMNNVPEEQLEILAQNILTQEDQSRRVYDAVENDKVFEAVKPVVTLKNKKISVEKFRELK